MPEFSELLKELIASKRILDQPSHSKRHPKYCYQSLLPLHDTKIELGSICRGIVVAKDDIKRELILHLTFVLKVGQQTKYINHQKMKAFIKDFNLKEPFSIFTYINPFKQIKLGTEITGVAIRFEKRKSQVALESEIYCELTVKNDVNKKYGSNKLGVSEDFPKWSPTLQQIFEKEQKFPLDHLVQYYQDFSNPGLSAKLTASLRIEASGSMSAASNLQTLDKLNLNYQRLFFILKIREKQEKNWAHIHFTQGLSFLKANEPTIAIDHLNIAKGYDPKNANIMVAKGCALANTNHFREGLKEIKQALSIDPSHKQALEYEVTIREQLQSKDTEGVQSKKVKTDELQMRQSRGHGYGLVKKRNDADR